MVSCVSNQLIRDEDTTYRRLASTISVAVWFHYILSTHRATQECSHEGVGRCHGRHLDESGEVCICVSVIGDVVERAMIGKLSRDFFWVLVLRTKVWYYI